MQGILQEITAYSFMLRAVLVGVVVALCAALLGVPLVLKRYSMIGDGLSHVAFGALALALAFEMALPALQSLPSPLLLTLPVVMLAAVLLLRISSSSRIQGDVAIGMLSTGAMAVGVMVMSVTSGFNLDVNNYLFGSILTTTWADVVVCFVTAGVVLCLYALFYHRIFAISFDETFSRATGTRAGVFNNLIAMLTAVVIVVGIRVMGAMLVSCLLVFPALTAMRLFKSFRGVVICASATAPLCYLAGVLLAFSVPSLPPGATVVVVNIGCFLLFSAIRRVRAAAFARG